MEQEPTPSQDDLHREAMALVRGLRLMELAGEVGEAHLVGSVPLKLIVKPDIDLHVLVEEESPPKPDGAEVEAALTLARGLMERAAVRKMELMRFLFRDAVKIGFDAGGERGWHVDLWLTTDPEHLGTEPTRWVQERLTPELRRAILTLKRYYAERDMCRFGMSRELYRAVIEHGVRTPRQFLDYARTHQLSYDNILEMLEEDAKTWDPDHD